MPALTLAIPRNAADFEEYSLIYALERFGGDGDLYGRPGTPQFGVDSIVRASNGQDVGVQSKRYYLAALSTKMLQDDLNSAHSIVPRISRYVVATTLPRDTNLQDWARSATIHGERSVEIWFWDTIAQWIQSSPTRKAKFLEIGAVDAAEIINSQLPLRSAGQILAYAAGGEYACPGESREVIEARAFLLSGNSRLAFDRVRHLLHRSTTEAAAWRIAASAKLNLGLPLEAIDLLDRAYALGLSGGRFDIVRAHVLIALERVDEATTVLRQAPDRSPPDELGEVLGALWCHCLEIENLTYQTLLDRIPPRDKAYPIVHLALANAAAMEGNVELANEHIQIVEKSRDLDHSIVPLLRASAVISSGEKSAARYGGEVQDGELVARIEQQTSVLELTSQNLRESPNNRNRCVALVWMARGNVLLRRFDKADAVFLELLELCSRNRSLLKIIAAYATSFGREFVLGALVDSPATKAHPLVRLLRLEFRKEDGVDELAEIDAVVGSLSDEDEWLSTALAAAVARPYNQRYSDFWVARAVNLLPTLDDVDQVVVALALALKWGGGPLSEKISAALHRHSANHRLSIGPLGRTVSILRLAEQSELHELYGAALDRAIDSNQVPALLEERQLIVRETLYRLGISRAARCLESWFVDNDSRRTVLSTRGELAWWRGDLYTVWSLLQAVIEAGEALPVDLAKFATLSMLCGRLRQARALLKRVDVPVTSAKDASLVANALHVVGLSRRREVVLARLACAPDAGKEALGALVFELTHRRAAPELAMVGVDTLVSLQHAENPDRRLQIWITSGMGGSAPSIERVEISDGWIQPFVGKIVDEIVEVSSGLHAGPWRIVRIQSGSAALLQEALHRAERIGLAGGGVDVIHAGDDPVEALRSWIEADRTSPVRDELGAPILLASFARKTIPLAIMSRFKHYRLHRGLTSEIAEDRKYSESARGRFIVDAATILLLENYSLLPVVSRAAGVLLVAPQSRLSLLQWWFEERERRRGLGSAGLLPDGRLVVESYDVSYRKRVAQFWRDLSSREGRELHVLDGAFPDDFGGPYAPLCEFGGTGLAASAAFAVARNIPIFSIDAELVTLLRDLGVPAVSLPGLLARGMAEGRIAARESAGVKSRLSEAGWTFVSPNTTELVAVLESNDDRRDGDLRAILRDVTKANVRSAVRVVVDALNTVGPSVSPISGEDTAEFLFRHLPSVKTGTRDESVGHVRSARKAWYRDRFLAWLKDGGQKCEL